MTSMSPASILSATLRPALLALALAALPLPALAQPPTVGTNYVFHDPVFTATVFCDSMDAIRDIATAAAPDDIYAGYYMTTDNRDGPMCIAMETSALVVEVVLLGQMVKQGHHYRAWAIETLVGGVTAFALYLEHFEYVSV